MIISGHLVSPYDVDPNNCKLPTFRKELRVSATTCFIYSYDLNIF